MELAFRRETMKLNGTKVKISIPTGSAEFEDLKPFFEKMISEQRRRGVIKNPFRTSP